jgi:hypothetical protein
MTTQVNSTVLGTLGNLAVTNDVRIGGNTLFTNGGYKTLAVGGSSSGGGWLQFLWNGNAGPYIYNGNQNLILWTDGGTPKITLNNAVNKSVEIVSANVDIVSSNVRVSGNLTVTGSILAGNITATSSGTANNASFLGGAPAAACQLGYGQTWQDVTASRTMGTQYTNSTGKPIMLIARAQRSAVSTSGIQILMNGIQIPVCFGTNSNGGNEAVGSIIIPVDATYTLSVSSEALTSYAIYELR